MRVGPSPRGAARSSVSRRASKKAARRSTGNSRKSCGKTRLTSSRGSRAWRGARGREEGGEPLDRQFAEELREAAAHEQPVLERIAGARGRLGPVADDPPA